MLVLPRPAKACIMVQASAEKLEHTGLAENGKSGLGATERAVGKCARAVLAKRKRNKAVSPKHQVVREERVKVGESRTLARKERGDQSQSMDRKGQTPQ